MDLRLITNELIFINCVLKYVVMDLSGKWRFKEDFGFGKDEGYAELMHSGDVINGNLEYTEFIENENSFKVKCELEGKVENNSVIFNVTKFKILSSAEPIEYYPEQREGIVNANGQIVGSSEDEQGICGVFVFDRFQE